MSLKTAKAEIRAAMEAHRAEGGEFDRDTWGIKLDANGGLFVAGPVCAIGAWVARQSDARALVGEDEDSACRRLARERLGLTEAEVDGIVGGFDDTSYDATDSTFPEHAAGAELAVEFVGPLDEDPEEADEECEPLTDITGCDS